MRTGSVVVGIFRNAGGRDPGTGGGKGGAVQGGDTKQNDGAEAGRGHLQLGVNFSVAFAAERNCGGCARDGVRARNACGNRGDRAGRTQGRDDQAANVDAQAARAEQRVVQEGSSPSGARMRGAISKSGANSSLAEESRRYADV